MTAKILQFNCSFCTPQNLIAQLNENPDTCIMIWHKEGKWYWDFYGNTTVAEMIGTMEVCKEDILNMYREHDK